MQESQLKGNLEERIIIWLKEKIIQPRGIYFVSRFTNLVKVIGRLWLELHRRDVYCSFPDENCRKNSC